MIISMTGFGRGEVVENDVEITCEIRTLNHRFLDISLRLPKVLTTFENEIRDLIRARLLRGRVEASIELKGEEPTIEHLQIDKALANKIYQLLNELKTEFKIDEPIKLDYLLNYPDIITTQISHEIDEKIWPAVKRALNMALDDLTDMRLREGNEIKKDLRERIENLNQVIEKIEEKTRGRSKEEFKKLKERIETLIAQENLDEERLEMEIALLADRVDVTEECIRFKSHNSYFMELLDNDEIAGRKLNFLLQEMHREANTIGAKCNDAQIAHWVVEVKEEVEKLREQIQNIE